ncbi:signal recognition particle-docking protein FtsY [uncultured Desulfobulbus sp.]|uniref:signal recognition particle-docking protein FtsY n=1 Tax=uncultured Desulfobulbus sp. TaxID=239745 RepID=UPI0029C7924C|nr:signal recognition particle-docking protein FtsY [uncultured Desulfobulbus sp.]
MLGWFKKKFGKQTADPDAIEADLRQEPVEEVLSSTPLVEPPPESIVEPTVVESDEPVAVAKEPLAVDAVADEQVMVEVAVPVVEPSTLEADTGAVADETVVEELAAALEQPVAEQPPAQAFDLPAEETPLQQSAEECSAITPGAAGTHELAEIIAEEPVAGEVDAGEEESALEPAPAEPIVPAEPLVAITQEKPASKSLFQRLQERLGKTKDSLVYRLDRLFLGKKEIDQDLFEQLEEILITADMGVTTTLELLDAARKKVKRDQLSDPQALKAILRDQILAYIEASEQPAELVMPEEGPFVIMVVGVNGVGKTTTIGKMAAKFVRAGQSVLMVAGDTFRAAAINQLRIWGERVGVEVIAQNPGSDPSSVVFDGLEYGVAHHHDVILIDTAGRLHTSVNLMAELKKIKRVIGKKMPGAPHEVMLVLDATTGQNGISQAKLFHEAVGVSGLTLTKLDGTAKGGIVANVCRETKIPVRFIGIGEQIDDLRDFDAREFVDALFAGQEG